MNSCYYCYVYIRFAEKFVFQEKAEECFAHVINTVDNNEVAKGLRYCGLLCNTAWESLRQVLTTYKMSCLIVKIVLSMENANFEKLCGYINNQEQVKQLSELYNGKQSTCMYSYAYKTHFPKVL